MSYEGYTEKLCKNGHLWGDDCYSDPTPCPQCGGEPVWRHNVDQTNGEEEMDDGTIHPDTTHWPHELLRYEEKTIVRRVPIYKIPNKPAEDQSMDKMDRYEKFSLAACRARIAELEMELESWKVRHQDEVNARVNAENDLYAMAQEWRREHGLRARILELEAALTDLYSLVRKQGMDEGFRQRIETALDRGGEHQ